MGGIPPCVRNGAVLSLALVGMDVILVIGSVVLARVLKGSQLLERLRETVGGGFLLPCAREDELFPGPALCLSRRMCGGRVFLGHGV